MVYRRTHQVVKRLAARRSAILSAARDAAAAGGMAAVQIAPVAVRANVAAGTVYRYFPSKAELFVEVLNAAVAHEVAIMERIASGPEVASERLRLAITAFVRRALAGPGLAHAFIVEPVDPDLETTSPPPEDGDGDGWDDDS